jgi:hypothetical protein
MLLPGAIDAGRASKGDRPGRMTAAGSQPGPLEPGAVLGSPCSGRTGVYRSEDTPGFRNRALQSSVIRGSRRGAPSPSVAPGHPRSACDRRPRTGAGRSVLRCGIWAIIVTGDLSQCRPRLGMVSRGAMGAPRSHRVPGVTGTALARRSSIGPIDRSRAGSRRPLAGPGSPSQHHPPPPAVAQRPERLR